MEVKKFIAILKQHYKVVSDEDLAKVLYMTQPAITHWKRRGIPKKVLKRYGEIIEQFAGKGETINVKHKDIPVVKEGSKVEVGADYIIALQKDKILMQEKEINELRSVLLKKEKQTMSNPIWEELDYDVMTTQVYETDNYAYFESYEVVRHRTFFAKLGYSEHEADKKYKELKSFVDAKETIQKASKINWLFIKNKTDCNILEWKSTRDFFIASKKKNMINALEMFKVTYKHKDGSSIPAIINVLYDFKGDSSISKIKFITD